MARRKKTVGDIFLEALEVKARFPIAAMAWYAQYSDPEAGREGTIQYVRDLTPGLTEEVATEFVDKLIAERRGPELTLPKLVEV